MSEGLVGRHRELREKAQSGGARYLPKLREQRKLTVRERLELLLDAHSFVDGAVPRYSLTASSTRR